MPLFEGNYQWFINAPNSHYGAHAASYRMTEHPSTGVVEPPSPCYSSDSEDTCYWKDRYMTVARTTIRRWRKFVYLKHIKPVCKGPWLIPGIPAKDMWQKHIMPFLPQFEHPAAESKLI